MKKMLEMRHIVKRFPGVVALNDVSFEAYEGEILALVGENGAGKSTLMKIISGFYPFSEYEGELWIDGEKVAFQNTSQAEKAGIAMIYQELNMHIDLSIAENIFMGSWPKTGMGTINWKKMYKESRHYIELVGLDFQPGTPLGMLSASQQQLVSIAKALAHNPRILVLDEPTASLAKGESDNLFQIIHSLAEKGITCILISHKLDEVFANAGRIVVLRDSHVIDVHQAEKADVDKIVEQMIGRELKNYYPKVEVILGDTVFAAEHISVPYFYNRSRNIVSDISFDVKAGEIFGLCGLVGSGRSEIANAIFGKLPLTEGKMYLNGIPLSITSTKQAVKKGIGLVTEDRKADGLVGVLSIKENLTLSNIRELTQFGIINKSLEREKCDYYYDKFKIKASGMNTLVQTLSGGNQQKVVLGRCLMPNPKLLILDEPTRGIDIGAKYEIYKIMEELANQGIAIILISSEMGELLSMSDRILILSNGKSCGVCPANQYTEEEIMKIVTTGEEVAV